ACGSIFGKVELASLIFSEGADQEWQIVQQRTSPKLSSGGCAPKASGTVVPVDICPAKSCHLCTPISTTAHAVAVTTITGTLQAQISGFAPAVPMNGLLGGTA